ncbi:MAG: hypothetical protein WC003_07380, partial [Terrimicrobiaceae bacterium]
THYNDDATAGTYAVEAGSPLVQSRFSLAKLAWLSQANPDTGTSPSANYNQAIKSCFGLVWDYPGGNSGSTSANGGNRCWNYVGSTGTIGSPPGTIKTLDQVAAEGREPNFFELLKAAILSGSLGKDPGMAAYANGTHTVIGGGGGSYDLHATPPDPSDPTGAAGLFAYSFDRPGLYPSPARISDMQIIRIGANIIDQYDADSYPTAIYFKYQGVGDYDPATGAFGHPLFGPVTMAYGDENLPALTRIMPTFCTTNRSGSGDPTNASDNATNTIAGWNQPEVWNPHQKPLSPLENAPRNFQIRAYGSARTFWRWSGQLDYGSNPYTYIDGHPHWGGSSATVRYFQTNDPNEPCEVGKINFTDTSATSSFYEHPFLLTTDGIPGVTASSPAAYGVPLTLPPGGDNVAKPSYPYYNTINTIHPNGNHFVAFCAGMTDPADNGGQFRPFYVAVRYCPDWRQPAMVSTEPGFWGAIQTIPVDTTGLGEANSYALGWVDGSGRFHPYSFLTGAFTYTYGLISVGPINTPDDRVGSVVTETHRAVKWYLADPRTERFSLHFSYFSAAPSPNNTVFPNNSIRNWSSSLMPKGTGFTPNTSGGYPQDWNVNSASPNSATGAWAGGGIYSYYSDPDGVVRPGDGIFSTSATGDGIMLFGSNASPTGSPVASGDSGGNAQHGRRPVILNRPFRSVGELGYAFRDLPFKALDFFTTSSADAALLDVFSLADEAKVSSNRIADVVAGQVNLSNAPLPVLQAILVGGSKKDLDPAYNLSATQGNAIARNIANLLNPSTGANPLMSRADLVARLGSDPATGPNYGKGPVRNAFTSSPDKGNKAYLEAPVRALSDVTNTRTWNLLIDVVAQSGRMVPTATALDNFMVEGERRYWLHVAIDRYTGKIVDQQLEPVYE